jgi:hypothetical protein
MRMAQEQGQYTRYELKWWHVSFAALLLLICCMLAGCQTIQPMQAKGTLIEMQEWTTPEPLGRVSLPREHRRSKAAMLRWIEQYLKDEYRVTDQRFVLTQPGFKQGAAIGSKANQYVTQKLGGTLKTDGWFDDESYRLFLFTFGDSSPRYIAFVTTRDFLPGKSERRMVGYFELVPSAKH